MTSVSTTSSTTTTNQLSSTDETTTSTSTTTSTTTSSSTNADTASTSTTTTTQWSYASASRWKSVNNSCGGKLQSPILINESAITNTSNDTLSTRMKYSSLSGRVLNNTGRGIQVTGSFGFLKLPDGNYNVKRLQFHFPSEHTFSCGGRALGELQIHHQKAGSTGNSDLAVVAIPLENASKLHPPRNIATQKAFMNSLLCGANKTLPASGSTCAISGSVDLATLFSYEAQGVFFHYNGSMTTPPCTEGVHWYVLQRKAATTDLLVKAFRKLYPNPPGNYRPTQALNKRPVVKDQLRLKVKCTGTTSEYPI